MIKIFPQNYLNKLGAYQYKIEQELKLQQKVKEDTEKLRIQIMKNEYDEDLKIATRKYRRKLMIKQMEEEDERRPNVEEKTLILLSKIKEEKKDKKIQELEQKVKDLEQQLKDLTKV